MVKTLLLAGCCCLMLAQMLAWDTATKRQEALETEQHGFYQALPPGEIAGTLLLGGFRGLATDLLWMRAVGAKQDGRFYESVALFELISRMQPRFEDVWQFMSWDMAYNIAHEVGDQEGRWAWFLEGIEANIRGCRLNPKSCRLLRNLAWMFAQKGESFMRRIEAEDWRPLLNELLAVHGDDLRLEAAGVSCFHIAERCYRASVRLSATAELQQPTFVRRMIPAMVEHDGNRLRNRGEHHAALLRYLDAIEAWAAVLDWIHNPVDLAPGRSSMSSLIPYERNEGRLRRKAATLARRLAIDPADGEATAEAILDRQLTQARSLLARTGAWQAQIRGARIQWLDDETSQ